MTDKADTLIYGRNPVLEQLKNEPGQIDRIYIRNGTGGGPVGEILRHASENRIPVSHVPGNKLRDLVGSVNDQGVVAMIAAVKYVEFHDWMEGLEPDKNTAVLLLEEIEDPHNFGAILRSAAGAGISAVLVPKHRQSPVNAAVFKTSAGTAGRIPIVRTVNLKLAVKELKDRKFWVAGLDQDAEESIWDMTADVPMAFVVGNEGRGLKEKTAEHCDFLYNIPMSNRVESLNASVSAALVCYEWRRKISLRGE